ncbi:hypothetical protein BN1723_009135 [Verticillium longisporum]|uniref:D-xylose 1-dehydrogenase (NADP(+), D-xylono-1,5-lactone-forming) n=1 Tax=Verticillium longisporum TaxID=100787 RepID=A0A0G4KM32_VERLO|nr:hypothetical protein BN1723_009135 [Verticillium longisporum]
MSFTLRWGILATGWIAETFSKDLLTNPATRDVSDVAHRIVAVSSSRDAQKARDFLTKIDGPQEAKTYGSYAELVADPDVDIIYVATPHSHHFQNAMLALRAGKHVLCEKALTVTAEQARRLVATAREKNLFFMEAVWTRYQPLSLKVRELVQAGEIGTVSRVTADLSFNNDQLVPWVTKANQPKRDAAVEPAAEEKPDETWHRYYHLYKEGELDADVQAVGGVVLESGYERDNYWWAICSRGPDER